MMYIGNTAGNFLLLLTSVFRGNKKYRRVLPPLCFFLILFFTETERQLSLSGGLCRSAVQYISSSATTCNKSQLSKFVHCILLLSEPILLVMS